MKKIVVEIDGVRHKLIEDKTDMPCEKCSLLYMCDEPICQHFEELCHFEKEESK